MSPFGFTNTDNLLFSHESRDKSIDFAGGEPGICRYLWLGYARGSFIAEKFFGTILYVVISLKTKIKTIYTGNSITHFRYDSPNVWNFSNFIV